MDQCHREKFADDTVVISLISNNMETSYLKEVGSLESWCKTNNLGTLMEKVSSYRYLRVHISEDRGQHTSPHW